MKAFIGGFGGSGSRLVTNIFERLGFYVGKEFSNVMYDFGENQFVRIFDKCFREKNYSNLFNFIDENVQQQNFIIKHGHFMFIIDELKQKYPDAKFIYVNRNPIDCALKLEYIPHVKYGNIPKNDLEKKIEFYIEKAKVAISKADLVINYENLCFNPKDEIQNIKYFCDINSNITDYSFIEPPDSIGIGKDYYEKYNF